MPNGLSLKDERPTSNIERSITPGREKDKHQIPNIQRLFLFLSSPSTPLRAVSPSTLLRTMSLSNGLSNGRFDARNENLN